MVKYEHADQLSFCTAFFLRLHIVLGLVVQETSRLQHAHTHRVGIKVSGSL